MWYSIVRIHYNLFFHSPLDEHLGCFQFCCILNKITMNVLEHVSFGQTHELIPLGGIQQEMELLSYRLGCIFFFLMYTHIHTYTQSEMSAFLTCLFSSNVLHGFISLLFFLSNPSQYSDLPIGPQMSSIADVP